MIWNAILSIAAGSFVWWMRSIKNEFQNVYDMIGDVKRRMADTREDIAKNYVAKDDFDRAQDDIIRRFDKLDEKLDQLLLKSARAT